MWLQEDISPLYNVCSLEHTDLKIPPIQRVALPSSQLVSGMVRC